MVAIFFSSSSAKPIFSKLLFGIPLSIVRHIDSGIGLSPNVRQAIP